MDWNSLQEDDEFVDPASPVTSATPERSTHNRMMLVLSALTLVLAGGFTGFFIGHANQNSTNAVAKVRTAAPQFPSGGFGNDGNYGNYGNYGGNVYPPTAPASSSPTPQVNSAAAKIAASVDPGLVDITTQLPLNQGTAAGTGMIISKNGLILTNNHVIAGATAISVRDVATGKTYKATVVGYDETSDVAVLQLKNASGLTTIKTNTAAVTKGESVVGIGNAGGVGGTPSFAAGSIVATNQSITAGDVANPNGTESLTGLIEVNAGIQAGDSGGALVNSKGKVIGMDTAASVNGGPVFSSDSSTTTQAFAIPISTALAVAKSIENGSSSSTVHVGGTAFIGIEVAPTSANPFPGYGNTAPSPTIGVAITGTVAGSPAAGSALTSGDVIVSVNGQSVTTITSLDAILQGLRPGDTVNVGYTNASGAQATLSLVLGSGPAQ
ncbi:MAG TPA: trypsin-like peptidase domain-containing protein [Acidimicrobiales bacterium]|nr:trypsin-like peptidase domain-containing protein [Acidimicrobiales bacterium]